MPSSRGLCVACNEAFQENGELASIPDASKVAFDVAHRRVWRICERCGEWNLLGQEASAAALPELEARFAAAAKAPGDAGFAPAHVGKALELVRIGGAAVQEEDDRAVLRRRKALVRRGTIALVAFGVAGVIGLADVVFISKHHIWTSMLVGYLTAGSMTFLATRVRRLRHGLPVSPRSVAIGVGLTLMGVALEAMTGGTYWLAGFIPMAVITGVFALLVPPIPIISVRLSHNNNVRFYSKKEVSDVTMSWTPDGEISLHDLPKGRSVFGDDADFLLHRLVKNAVRMRILLTVRSATEQAYELLRVVGGRRGLLRALDGFRRDSDDRVVIAKLPKIYLTALDLVLAEPVKRNNSFTRLRQKANEASAIAREAEALDKQFKE